MNVTYLVFTILAIAACIYCLIRAVDKDIFGGFAMIFGIVGGLMLTLSAVANFGTTTTYVSKDFLVEKTQYRLIVLHKEREFVFKDAYSLINVDKWKAIKITQEHNAWGSTVNEPKLYLLTDPQLEKNKNEPL